MAIKVRTQTGLSAGGNASNTGSPSYSATPLSHKDIDNNFKSVWPVGSIYFNVSDSRNPHFLLGFGEWKPFGEQKVLVGKNDLSYSDSQDFSRRILSAEVSSVKRLVLSSSQSAVVRDNVPVLVLECDNGNSPFSEGQKVTISNIEKSGGVFKVNPNRERRILHIGNASQHPDSLTTHITVDYSSPSNNPNSSKPFDGEAEDLSVNVNSQVSLFGTTYVDNPLKDGQGGEFSINLDEDELPAHHHKVNWQLAPQRSGVTNQPETDGGKTVPFTQENRTLHSKYSNSKGSTDPVKLSARGWTSSNNLQNGTYGFAHENLMPFIGAYMWIRIS